MSWSRGMRVPVSELGATDEIELGIGTRPDRFSVVVAGLGADEDLIDRGFLLSEHQPESFEGSVAVRPGSDGDRSRVVVRLDRVPSSIEVLRIAVVGDADASADDLEDVTVRVLVDGRQTTMWDFPGSELSGERALILCDLYRRNGWRIHLNGTGYRAGLTALLASIDGGQTLPGAPSPASTPEPPVPAPEPPDWPPPLPEAPAAPPPPAPPPPPVTAPPPPAPSTAAPRNPAGYGPPAAPAAPGLPPVRAGKLRTGLSLRERLISVPVGKALVSPSGGAALAGGAVVGGAGALAAFGVGALALGAVGLGGAAWLGRGVAAMPGKRRGEKIDPFALREPWRHFVNDAVRVHRTFTQLVDRTPAGPLHDRLAEIGERLESGVEECWRIASRGDSLREARVAMADGAARAELAAIHAQPGAHDPAARARLAEALQSQIDAADRLDRTIDRTYDQLRLLDARLDNAVARALEISATAADSASFGRLGAEVDDLVGDLEALRQGLDEVRAVDPGTPMPG